MNNSLYWLLMASLLLACIVSAVFWRRSAWARWLPVLLATLMGVLTVVIYPNDRDFAELALIVGAFALAGGVLQFSIWVESRDPPGKR